MAAYLICVLVNEEATLKIINNYQIPSIRLVEDIQVSSRPIFAEKVLCITLKQTLRRHAKTQQEGL